MTAAASSGSRNDILAVEQTIKAMLARLSKSSRGSSSITDRGSRLLQPQPWLELTVIHPVSRYKPSFAGIAPLLAE
jgi:hypothetical protein